MTTLADKSLHPGVTARTTCRLCGSAALEDVFSLGTQYLSDFVAREDVLSGVRCPLDVVRCPDCTLVQLRHTAPQELLYRRHYHYKSGITQTMRDALRDVARDVESRVPLRLGDVVVDVGSNDGSLLRSYSRPGIVRVGVEPATNLHAEGRVGIDRLVGDFWRVSRSHGDYFALEDGGKEYWFHKARAITACGMLYDLEEPGEFVRDLARALAHDGIILAQLMCLRQMLASNDVGNLVAEHLSHYTLKSLERLFAAHGLALLDVGENAVNNGSYRLVFGHAGQADPPADARRRIEEARAAEEGLDDPSNLRAWFAGLDAQRRACADFVRAEAAAGRRVFVLGASTKGSVILQWLGLDHTVIAGASERSPEKVGKYTSGTGVRIYSEEEARALRPNFFLVLPYTFRSEIIQRERAFLESGGRLIFPLPRFEVVGKEVLP